MGVCEGEGSGLHSLKGLPVVGGGLRLRECDGCGCGGGGVRLVGLGEEGGVVMGWWCACCGGCGVKSGRF